ncbi:MAG: hypothetical protein HC845_02610 [Akkermansiaceae bacterium]|nr:hypothetical protein [Akkermansiaceae bacterium]
MNPMGKLLGLVVLFPMILLAEEAAPEDPQARLQLGASKVADQQDELAADVQQLVVEQTIPKVIELFNEVEAIMDEATEKLASSDTGSETIAAQTEIIEKIHAAAKEKQKQQGSGQSGGAMMDMMERMMGKSPEGDQKGKGGKDGEGEKPSEQGGKGKTGLSDSANQSINGENNQKSEARRVPKASSSKDSALPEEFRKALDAYNRGAEQKVK